MYRLTDVIKNYRKGGATVAALQDVNLVIEDGEWLAIQGPTGHGKSTLLQIIGALDRPTSGDVEFDGACLSAMPERRVTKVRARSIGHRLTLGPGDELGGPADVSDVLAGLALAMSCMPRLLGQLAAFLEVEHVQAATGPGGPAGTGGERVREISDALHRAGLDAETMAAALDAARQACAELAAAARRGPDRP
jgi:energy-coupling factor transporter ATP-binding protein EcfA2